MEETQSLQVAASEHADGRERLGSRSEVEGFRVESRDWLLVEGFTPSEQADLLNEPAVKLGGSSTRRGRISISSPTSVSS